MGTIVLLSTTFTLRGTIAIYRAVVTGETAALALVVNHPQMAIPPCRAVILGCAITPSSTPIASFAESIALLCTTASDAVSARRTNTLHTATAPVSWFASLNRLASGMIVSDTVVACGYYGSIIAALRTID